MSQVSPLKKRLHRDGNWCQQGWGTITQKTQGRGTKEWMWNNHREKQKWGKVRMVVCLRADTLCWWGLFTCSHIVPLLLLLFPFLFAPLSFVPFALSSLGAICLPSVSPVMLQMAFVRDVGDHRGFLSIWPWHALLLSLAAWCSTCKSPSSLDPYCWCLADRGPRLSPSAPVVITASLCLEQAAKFAFPLDCVSLLPFVEKNCQHSSRPWLLFSLFFSREWWCGSLITLEQL